MTDDTENQKKVESLYIPDGDIVVPFCGINLTLHNINGPQFLKILTEARASTGNVDLEIYSSRLIKATVISPKIDVGKLQPRKMIELQVLIEKTLNLSQEGIKNSS